MTDQALAAAECSNHPGRKVKRAGLCGVCYERVLHERNPEYAAREKEHKTEATARRKAADPEGFAKRAAEHTAKYRAKHPERIKSPWVVDPVRARAAIDKYRATNIDKVRHRSREWYRTHPEEAKQYRESVRERIAERAVMWRKKNPHKARANGAAYRASLLRAIPPWADFDEINRVYGQATSLGLEVDHVIPLRGDLVSGLHVANNLQLLSRSENASKSNKFNPEAVWQ